jgi:hypothetical protein
MGGSGMNTWKMVIAIGILSVCLTSPIRAQMEHQKDSHQCEHEHYPGMEKMKIHWENMEKISQELKAHTESMKGVTDRDKLIPELVKHQEMVDAFIGSMMELQQMRHEMKKEQHQKMEKSHMKGHEMEHGGAEKE